MSEITLFEIQDGGWKSYFISEKWSYLAAAEQILAEFDEHSRKV